MSMVFWEDDMSEKIVLKPIEIRAKRGRKKMKKVAKAIYVPNMDSETFKKICTEKELDLIYVEVPPHGDLIDRESFIAFIKMHWDSSDQWFVDQLEARPTIIPAEEGET